MDQLSTVKKLGSKILSKDFQKFTWSEVFYINSGMIKKCVVFDMKPQLILAVKLKHHYTSAVKHEKFMVYFSIKNSVKHELAKCLYLKFLDEYISNLKSDLMETESLKFIKYLEGSRVLYYQICKYCNF